MNRDKKDPHAITLNLLDLKFENLQKGEPLGFQVAQNIQKILVEIQSILDCLRNSISLSEQIFHLISHEMKNSLRHYLNPKCA